MQRLFCLSLTVGKLALLAQVGLFGGAQDIGKPGLAGSVRFDAATGVYEMRGSGANVWGKEDAFQFAWKKVAGDAMITAEVEFVGAGKNAHRKAMLMLRQSLRPDAAYADAALHGDGLLSLQYRRAEGATTEEARAEEKTALRLRILKRGETITLFTAAPGGWSPAATARVPLQGLFYIGLGVCSHDESVVETVRFRNVAIEHPPTPPRKSRVHVYDLKTGQSRLVHEEEGLLEAPNWSRDGKYLLVNARGRLFRLDPKASGKGRLEPLALPESYRCNNDHDLSPDGKRLAFSASTPEVPRSRVFVANADGSDVRVVTSEGPSYFHGWSPDGRWLAFVANRGKGYEVYRAPAAGGPEERLTSSGGYDDGPEYSPDGKWIYFNSDRSGGWDIWRMPVSGAGDGDKLAERVTSDEGEDWFPHFDRKGRTMLFLSFPPGTIGHNGRMAGMKLRRLGKGGKIETLVEFFGGQGSINVNSWHPKGQQFAYVSYELDPL